MKPIKFSLFIDNIQVRSVDDLRAHFHIGIINLHKEGLLLKWLTAQRQPELLTQLEGITKYGNDQEQLDALCHIFSIEPDKEILQQLKQFEMETIFLSKLRTQNWIIRREYVGWFRRAILSEVDGQYELAKIYKRGRFIEQSYIEAFEWYRKAAEQGHVESQHAIGEMYEHGRGVTPSDTDAFEWYRKAAEQGHVESQHAIGEMYEHGRGVTPSDAEAFEWYRKAAEQGHVESQHAIGEMYEHGRGVTPSDAEAFEWYRKAAEQGYVKSQCALGKMYEHGRGVAASNVKASEWYRKAAIASMGLL
jgi:TPR repeat protein